MCFLLDHLTSLVIYLRLLTTTGKYLILTKQYLIRHTYTKMILLSSCGIYIVPDYSRLKTRTSLHVYSSIDKGQRVYLGAFVEF